MRKVLAAILGICLLGGAALAAPQEDRREQWHAVDPEKNRQAPAPENRVDINRATVEELMKVPGMTRGWALRIVRYRPYRTKADLYLEGIVPPAVYERIRYNIIAHRVVSPETSAPSKARAGTAH